MTEDEQVAGYLTVCQLRGGIREIGVRGIHQVRAIRRVPRLGRQQRVLNDCLRHLEEDQTPSDRVGHQVGRLERRHEAVVYDLRLRKHLGQGIKQGGHLLQGVLQIHNQVLWLREVDLVDVSDHEHLRLLQGGPEVVEVDG